MKNYENDPAKCKWCGDTVLAGYDDYYHNAACCIVEKIEKFDLPDVMKQWLITCLLSEPSGIRP